MRSQLATLYSNTRIYLISNLCLAAVPFFLLPLLSRYLGPVEYGRLAMFQLLVAAMSVFVGFGINGYYKRTYFSLEPDHSAAQSMLASDCLRMLSLACLTTLFLLLPFHNLISVTLNLGEGWIFLAVILVFLRAVINLRSTNWQVTGDAKSFAATQIMMAIFEFVFSIITVIFYASNSLSRIGAQVFTAFVFACYGFLSLHKERLIVLRPTRLNHHVDILKFGLPLIPHSFSAVVISSADRFFINEHLGLKEVGIYMLAVQAAMVLNIFFDAINKAYVPWLYNKLERDIRSELVVIVFATYIYFIFLIMVGLIGGFFIAPRLVMLIGGADFGGASDIIGWLIMGQILNGMYLMVTNYIFFAKRTGLLSLVTIVSGLVNIMLLVGFIVPFGLRGAAFAFFISMLIRFFLTWAVAAKVFSMPWLSTLGFPRF
ncbi:oligosaccharide flippase family protein [Gammaproteobacteria bacterium]|nr:oligosaccharide flippase family protein [Gammaproteobacteria bacterium]